MRGSHLASAGLLVSVAFGSGEVGASNGAHRDAICNFLTVKHCGLETYEVGTGFRIEVIGLIEDGDISPSAAKSDRDAVAGEVRRDWHNRGLRQADPRCLPGDARLSVISWPCSILRNNSSRGNDSWLAGKHRVEAR